MDQPRSILARIAPPSRSSLPAATHLQDHAALREIDTLLADGLHSASHIARLGKGTFTTRYATALGRRRAKVVYERARHVSPWRLRSTRGMPRRSTP